MFKKQKENPQDVLFSFTNEQNKEKERRDSKTVKSYQGFGV